MASTPATQLPWYWARNLAQTLPAVVGSTIEVGQTYDSTADHFLPNGVYLASVENAVTGATRQASMWLSVQDAVISYTAKCGNIGNVAVGTPTPFDADVSMLLVTTAGGPNVVVVCNGYPTAIPISVDITVYRFI